VTRTKVAIDYSRLSAAAQFSQENNYKLSFYGHPLDMKQRAVPILISFVSFYD
jgi:hypothetical protein